VGGPVRTGDERAADLARYRRLKRAVTFESLPAVLLIAAGVAVKYPSSGAVLAIGGACGVANALLTMYGNERLLDGRGVGAFVISSFPRIGLFGIVPVVLALKVPGLWTLGWYFAGFFAPLALYGLRTICTNR
jgi:hypothetical protein